MRFEIQAAKIIDADGVDREYQVIADLSTFTREQTDYGSVRLGSGFIRCSGKHYVGQFGNHTPIYGGSDNDTYYAPMHFFDGDWWHAPENSRGLHDAVTADSGTDKLFAELEAFSESQSVAAQY